MAAFFLSLLFDTPASNGFCLPAINKSEENVARIPFVTEIIKRIAPRIGASVLIEPEYEFVGQITFKNGHKTLYRNTNFNINHLGSVEIARDKAYSNFFLRKMGYSVTEGQTFFSEKLCRHVKIKRTINDGYAYAKQLGFPVIVKPNTLSQGTLVAKVYNKQEYYKLAKKIFKRVQVLIVERFYEGKDYRIVVLDDEVISAYERISLSVTGDGTSTIRTLLEKKQTAFVYAGRDTILDMQEFRMKDKLHRQGLSLTSILQKGQQVFLLDNANLSTGGESCDVTHAMHKSFCDLAIRITKDMGLRLCGVDIITQDITAPAEHYVIIEINGAPGLDNYASMGQAQSETVDNLYLKVLKALERTGAA
jgi:D-alanine-D-alanine ligase-like ATP-grasp enzyme